MEPTVEDLMASLITKLEGFQRSPLHCEENELALRHLRAAQKLMEMRTRDRTVRGVEGTQQP